MSDGLVSVSEDSRPRRGDFIADNYVVGFGFVLIILSIFAGRGFWSSWFTQVDSILTSIGLLLGAVVAVVRSKSDAPPRAAHGLPWLLFAVGMLTLFLAVVLGRPKLGAISLGFAVAGVMCRMLRSGTAFHALSLGLVPAIPVFLDTILQRGGWELVERFSGTICCSIADTLGFVFFRRGDQVEFSHGVGDRFSFVGGFDSGLAFLGMGFFFVYSFKRTVLQSILTLGMTVFTWAVVRASAWVAFAWLAARTDSWAEWSVGTELLLLLIGGIQIGLWDQFFGALLDPIPQGYVSKDLPLGALLWNLVVSLPSVGLPVEHRNRFINEPMRTKRRPPASLKKK
jgi:hypothetical protein